MPGQVKLAEENDIPFSRRPVVVLGAGIIGCSAALQLLQNGFQVTLVGEYLPGDDNILYASAWAGAAWHAAAGIPDDQKYLQAVTHRRLLQMAQEDPTSGVCIVQGREYLEQAPGKNSSLWGQTVLKNFRTLKPGEYPPNFDTAWSYDCLVVDPTIHIPWVGAKVRSLGGEFVRRKVQSLKELYDLYPQSTVFINASGWGSRDLTDVRDEKSFPDRGQNVRLRTSEHHTMYFRNGKEYTYIIPRPLTGHLILGGHNSRDNLSGEPDLEVARDEIRRAHILAPEVVPAEPAESDISYVIGIRPGREGGFRLDSQKIGNRTVLSAYGFAGGGYAFSYGVADALYKMVEQAEFDYVITPGETSTV
ncbi:FAD dependent oxidoreductase superfamily [Talaromyces proteolyticus]|uniref:FAD dependent oxidoreductase superfamily n=1 Tax=Talaromyces proteolyticus TaxID=1131652 RepID=A0AAD4KX25_9EURO|nr:FAD dependent oxidoreductase superfamily [Talaromyces proteolyticus]KAH8703120.1 FAD dependent oxidoreductase superfamily [Talaromyces proteolyticus]